eukprot:7567899-Karenia_brevis.AAC.1
MQMGGAWNKENDPWAASSKGKGKSNAEKILHHMAHLTKSSLPWSCQSLTRYREYGNPEHGVTEAKMPDFLRVSIRTTAEGFYQPLGDITNSSRSVPVSADPSAACSRTSSAHSQGGLGAVPEEQWGDKRKR